MATGRPIWPKRSFTGPPGRSPGASVRRARALGPAPPERLEEPIAGARAIVEKEAKLRVELQKGKTTLELLGLGDKVPSEETT